ncbi:MAG: helix-turn-helix domain-containing protein [Deltaproteobacteria bacterium]|nr:helix-turn-helix domain-containing protein [Deltaproteobacteria bacterium]
MTKLPNKPLLRPDEVADYWSVAVSTIYSWIDQGVIQAVKKGGTIRIPREEALKSRPVVE